MEKRVLKTDLALDSILSAKKTQLENSSRELQGEVAEARATALKTKEVVKSQQTVIDLILYRNYKGNMTVPKPALTVKSFDDLHSLQFITVGTKSDRQNRQSIRIENHLYDSTMTRIMNGENEIVVNYVPSVYAGKDCVVAEFDSFLTKETTKQPTAEEIAAFLASQNK